ncbi:MAG: UvrD-helicase domain-containing protein [Treponema sp.]|nr:UvrD-helicase domain-containing protein [Treponema sp.]
MSRKKIGDALPRLDIQNALNGPQLRAATSIEGPLSIIAGAGSGKTRVITYRIAYMLSLGISPGAILALTFTNKAAREMESRAKELAGGRLEGLTVSTFHAFGLSIIRENAEALGYRKSFSIYDESDRETLIKESLRECRMSTKKVDIWALGQLFSNVRTGLASFGAPGGRRNAASAELLPVYEAYRQGLKVYNAVDFDDLLALPLELFSERPEALEEYRARFRYILVDEFQDTSAIQYKLLRALALKTEGATANVCIVGDDDQSIYSWRGANAKNLAMFEEDFPGAIEIKLEQNYRSTSTILDAANGLIAHNTGRKEKKLWSGRDGGKPIELVFPENEGDEADFIATKIRELMTGETRRYHEFGVLTRTNSLARNIEEAFLAKDIPYKVSGGTSFFQRKEIKDIVSYMRAIANPDDDLSLLRIINTPARGVGRSTVAALSEIAKKNKTSIWGAILRLNHSRSEGQQQLFQDKKTLTELECFVDLMEAQREEFSAGSGAGRKTLAEKTRALVDGIDYWSHLITEHGQGDNAEKVAAWKFANVGHYIKMIENWERSGDTRGGDLREWLGRISLITRDDGETDALGKVSLMTIHSAKGLEFPVVFIAGAEKGLIPHDRSADDAQDEEEAAGNLEEERRLFYVALTRARERLFITACKTRRRLQGESDREPSPFIAEIPDGLIQNEVVAPPLSPEEEEALAQDMMEKIRARIKSS